MDIRMDIRKAINLVESQNLKESFEITSDSGDASMSWPNVTYHGDDLFDIYIEFIENQDFPYNNQESYLGYIPSKDMFVSGFDIWTEGYNGNDIFNVVYFKIKNGLAQRVGLNLYGMEDENGSVMMYGQNGGLEELRQTFPDLVDVRLD